MANSGDRSFIEGVMLILSLIVWIVAGVWAWDWIEPESFGGALVFLLAWGVLGYIGHIILGFVMMKLFGKL